MLLNDQALLSLRHVLCQNKFPSLAPVRARTVGVAPVCNLIFSQSCVDIAFMTDESFDATFHPKTTLIQPFH